MQKLQHRQQDEEFVQAIKDLPLNDKLKAIALATYRTQWLDAEEALNKKIDEIKKQHFISLLPLQKQSNQIIQGTRAPTQLEIKDADQYLTQAEQLEKASALTKEPLKDFWTRTLLNAPIVAEICAEEDLPILQHLMKIENEFDPKTLDFTIKFEFSNNEYFTDKVLEKKFIFDASCGDIPVQTVGSTINWKTGKNITKKILKKKQRNKKTGASRQVDEEVDIPSFFQFFRAKINDSEEGGAAAKLQMDYEIAQQLVEEIIPGALDFYLGVQKGDMEGEGDDEDDGDDDDDEDEDADDDDDDEDDE